MSSPAVDRVRNIPLIVESKGGFPFDRDQGKDRERPFRSQLDDIARRHPEFAEHLNFGEDFPFNRTNLRDRIRRESDSPNTSRRFADSPFGSRFERRFPFTSSFDEPDLAGPVHEQQQQKQPEQPKQEPEPENSNKQQPEESEGNRGQRSMSAPPENRQQRFVSSCQIPVNSGDGGMGQRASQQKSNERVIPIHVEGRDEPVIPRNVQQSARPQTPPQQQQPQPERVFGHKPTQYQHFVPQPQEVPVRPAEVEIPVKHENKQPQQQQQRPQTPVKVQKEELPKPQPKPDEQQEQPQQQQKLPDSQIDKIQMIQKDVLELMDQVEKFDGKYKDKQYLYLDEMLTRNLIKLDNIDTEGKDNIRQARREAIRCIEKCISILEAKAKVQTPQPVDENQMETETIEPAKPEVETATTALEVGGVSRSGTEAQVGEATMEVEAPLAQPETTEVEATSQPETMEVEEKDTSDSKGDSQDPQKEDGGGEKKEKKKGKKKKN